MLRLVRHALRQLREAPGFAITAILTLTLGIGATTAIFGVLDAVLLEPLPFPQPDRLVVVQAQPDPFASIPTMQDYQARSKTFQSLAAYRAWSPVQKAPDGASARRILIVSQGFFSTLGLRFALGGGWPVSGNEQDCSSLATVSAGYWQRLGGGASLAGRVLHLDGRDFQIAGVLPAEQAIEGTNELNQPEVFLPIGCDPEEHPGNRGSNDFGLIGRLKPGVSIRQAAADLAVVDRTLRKEYPNDYGGSSTSFGKPPLVLPYIELLVGTEAKPALLLTFTACGFLLVIACANLTNLLLARNTRRRAEFALRATLGATLGQLLQQLMVESLVLVVFGATGGIALAAGVLAELKRTTVLHLPRLAHASIRPGVLLFTVVLCAAVVFFLTLLPASRTLRPGLLRDMQGAGRSTTGQSLRLAGRVLVVSQLTLAIVLLACAGWMIGGVYLLLHQPLGFEPDHLLITNVLLGTGETTHEQDLRAEQKLTVLAENLHLPGVMSVAMTDTPPLGHHINRYSFCSDAHPEQCRAQININPNSYAISPAYFSTIGQPLLEGRDFNPADAGRSHVAIVNRALAAQEWPGQSALGHRVHTGEIDGAGSGAWATVVGVVGDVHNYDLASLPSPDLYIPRIANPSGSAKLVLRTAGDPESLEHLVRETLKRRFPEVEIRYFETMADEMQSEVAERVFLMQLAIAFGATALFLAILGTYGLLAYEVSLREKEIGIRLALGSSRERVVTLLLREEGRWLAAGAALGLGCAAAIGHLLRARFYGAESTSFLVLFVSAVLLLGPALLAVALPASRAALLDPAETLRRE